MPKDDPLPRQDKLIDQYRAIGPAMLIAALMSKKKRDGQARNDNANQSILAVKKPG
ncbi:hydrolase [Brucella thiophenivorans]|uniref:Uncharacterized protein n=1 Tax=Brucella thiophenivorans TaxID=571255 RepID=A0A256FV78_9HYPH|nr:hydrolase [Brucella thiophenivorans]OYR18723.1 hypothetical protein CEV31_2057 [Brucella thiophenivorans]